MNNIRQRIIEYLSEHRAATAIELSRFLSLTPSDVRHHLAQLIKQGSIVISGHRLSGHKGRPSGLYSLVALASRSNINLLAHHLLTILFQHSPNDNDQLIKNIAGQFASGRDWHSLNITRRIFLTINFLNEMNYDASWEAHSASPRLILRHCPFIGIIEQHPEICRIDEHLLEILLSTPVRQIEKLTASTYDLPYCVFVFQ